MHTDTVGSGLAVDVVLPGEPGIQAFFAPDVLRTTRELPCSCRTEHKKHEHVCIKVCV